MSSSKIAYIRYSKLVGLQSLFTPDPSLACLLIQATNAKATYNSHENHVGVFLDEFQCIESFEERTEPNQVITRTYDESLPVNSGDSSRLC